jgi:hypothetical protein
MRNITIGIRESADQLGRKIVKVFAYGDGGFGISVPYHSAQKGWACKMPIDYRLSHMAIPRTDRIEFSAEDRVKLSLHPDGFTQFSTGGALPVKSGRHIDGKPKGLGVLGQPFSNPVLTGPTFGVMVWGLHEYPLMRHERTTDVMFETADIQVPEQPGAAYLIEGFLFPSDRFQAGIQENMSARSSRRHVLTMATPLFQGRVRTFDFTVLLGIADPQILVCLMMRRIDINFVALSGYQLSGPSERIAGPVKHGLFAQYPPPMEDPPVDSLMYPTDD